MNRHKSKSSVSKFSNCIGRNYNRDQLFSMQVKQKQNHKVTPSVMNDLKTLWSYLSNRRKVQMLLFLLLMLLSSLSEVVSLGAIIPFLSAMSNPDALLNNQKLQSIFSTLSIETPEKLVTILAMGFIAAVLLANGLRLLTLHVRVRLAAAIGADISSKIFHNTLRQSYSFHTAHNSSDLMQTIMGDSSTISNAILNSVLTLINDSLLVSSIIITLLIINTRIALGSTIILGGAYIVIFSTRQRLLKRNSQVISQASQRKIKVVQEGIGGVRDILLNHTQDFFENVYCQSEQALKKAISSNSIISQSPRYLIEAIALSAISLLALNIGQNGDFTRVIPVLGSLTLGAKKLVPALQGVFTCLARIQGSRASLSRVLVALKRPVNPLLYQVDSFTSLPLKKEIRLEDVWFRYGENNDWVLRGLNLTIAAKTTVGFVGSTGSGKSTTTDLILGLLQPQKGSILVDGLPLEGERLYQWQKNIAHVPQSIFLSDGTIATNIAFGIPENQINLEQVQKAAQLAQIADFIEDLPAQYDTYVGERGIRLSGGQRQRIGIARALYGNASVIVFDEATSALDNATEREVMSAIESLSHNFTIILIAHRLTTVENCDRIFELNQGRVVSEGTYQELLNSSVTFRQMVKGC